MPFAVRKFPDSNDPRGPFFMAAGFAWGAVPAIRYMLRTTGATGPCAPLNSGVVLPFLSSSGFGYDFARLAGGSITFDAALNIDSRANPVPSPINHTVRWVVTINFGGSDFWQSIAYDLNPNAITGWPTHHMHAVGSPPGTIPAALQVVPCIWDHALTP